jgi:hypothetical protein
VSPLFYLKTNEDHSSKRCDFLRLFKNILQTKDTVQNKDSSNIISARKAFRENNLHVSDAVSDLVQFTCGTE